MSTHAYNIVYEEGAHNWSAYVEDLPGTCIATGATREDCERNMREAIEFHAEGLSPQEREKARSLAMVQSCNAASLPSDDHSAIG